MDGIIIINKEKGYTSHDAVYKIKKMFNTKVGHTGTLDPNATGVLPILLGKGTKLSKYLIEHDKEYEVLLQLGTKTTTADEEGEEVEKKCVPEQYLQFKNIEKILKSFIGESQQVPPMYSAIKVNGKKLYEYAEKITGIDIAKISFDGPDVELNKTQNTQLAILIECLGISQILKKNGIIPDAMAGLSLGEYTALIEDGVFNIEDGINIVSKRGEIMQNFTPKGNWKMAAILGLDDENVEEICKNISSGFVKPANYNTLGQVVISGEEQAVLNAGEEAKKAGAKKVSMLNTAGPFHTEKLSKCSIELKKELDKISINSKNSIVIKNLDGKYYEEKDNISEILAKHIMNPVRFTECLKTMYESGIDTFIEIGPGKTLSGFVKRMKFENVKIMNINDVSSLEQVIKEVKENG